MGRENFFHVEKHANDALHNPPSAGRTHTHREIDAASRALGRLDDGFRRKRSRASDASASRGLRAGDVVVVDGAVVRVNVDARPAETATRATRREEVTRALASTRTFAEPERWKTMNRIEMGGTGGATQLREARRAALGLDGGRRRERDADDDDGPTVVPEEDLHFVDGWAISTGEETRGRIKEVPKEEPPEPLEKVNDKSLATIGRKAKRRKREKVGAANVGRGALSFDADY
ncbi:unnamed product [Ostreococcus tauri]|uniref:Unnamed product n=1 Tax=Ostreococcus tauri TaxID=70448 RepID=A0A090LXE2_OSTTA|nr:unnamed product [Ostreococcus tauri]CEF96476.1 unnamed product [Ostreococcus tauri]|eukprot:XP_022838118.1 unnamed product [Ostreococcus tauri]